MSSNASTGQILGYVVGAVVGYFTGGAGFYATLAAMGMGASVGGAIGGAIDPPKGPRLQGPRLDDLSVQASTYGATIPRVYGTAALMGNVFWLENNRLKESAKTESQGGKGGGGGAETTTFSYSATFALGLCRGPIIGVRRLWVGSKLVYDAGSDDPDAIAASNDMQALFTLHTGTDDQLPDDRMQATLGIDNTPAYRGLAYLVFKDYPLADHGNSLLGAQVKAEVVASGSYGRFVCTDRSAAMPTGDWNDVAWNGNVFCAVPFAGDDVAISSNGIDWTINKLPHIAQWAGVVWTGSYFCAISEANLFTAISVDGIKWFSGDWPSTNCSKPAWNGKVLCALVSVSSCSISYDGVSWDEHDLPAVTAWSSVTAGGEILVAASSADGIGAVSTDGISWSLIDFPTTGDWSLMAWNGDFFCAMDNSGNSATSADGVVWSLHPGTYSWTYTTMAWGGGVFAAFATSHMITSPDGVTWTERPFPAITPKGVAWNDAEFCIVGYNSEVTVRPYAITSTPPALGDIVQAEVLQSALIVPGDLDVSELVQPVRGYRVAGGGAIRSSIEPLQGAWPFDIVQHGYQIKFKMRGGASSLTIPESDLGARSDASSKANRLTIVREMDSVLPQRVIIKYLDLDREYDHGEQYDERLNTSAINQSTIDLPIVMNAEEGASTAQMLLYLYWLERRTVSFCLPPAYNHLEPADTISVEADGAVYPLRLTSVDYGSDGCIECQAKLNASEIYLPTALGESGQSTGMTLQRPGDTFFVALDIPALLDIADRPGFPVAMWGNRTSWRGGILYRSDDSGQTWNNLFWFSSPGATAGYATDILPESAGSLIDKAGVLTVYLLNGQLSSVSESQMLSGANHFAYGVDGRWEIIAAMNCVQAIDGYYVLTDFLRGRFGTEWASGQHAIQDSLILLDAESLAFIGSSINSVGSVRQYRGVTAGRGIATAPSIDFTYRGVNLECVAPVYLTGWRHPSSADWSLSWIRRTRVGGEWRAYVDAALGESSEAYEVDIMAARGSSIVKRTLLSGSASATYTAAEQIADFGSAQGTLFCQVYQKSSLVGRGYPLVSSVSMPGADPFWNNVVLAVHFDSAVSDVKGNSISVVGNAVASTLQSKFGGYAGKFDGTGDYFTTASLPAFTIGADNFTVDGWVYFNAIPAAERHFYAGGNIDLRLSPGGNIRVGMPNGVITSSSSTIGAGVWIHLAISRSGGVVRLFINGVLDAQFTNASPGVAGAINLGGNQNVGDPYHHDGYLDDWRVTIGAARYLADFSAALPLAAFSEY